VIKSAKNSPNFFTTLTKHSPGPLVRVGAAGCLPRRLLAGHAAAGRRQPARRASPLAFRERSSRSLVAARIPPEQTHKNRNETRTSKRQIQ